MKDDATCHSLLTGSVCQVVEVDVLAVSVDPGRDDPKPVEAGARRTMPLPQVQYGRFLVQRDDNPAPSGGCRRGIVESPVVGPAVGEDLGSVITLASSLPILAGTVKGIEEKAVAAGTLHGHAKEVLGGSGGLGLADLDTSSGMKEPDQRGTV